MEYTEERPLKVFTAFSGYDSQCLALKRLGIPFDLVGFSEIDKYAIQAHDVLFPEYADRNYGDISKIEWEQVPYFDLFTMSSPCQDFSVAGMQKGGEEGSGTRSSLLWECRRAILAKKPKYILMENVKALVSAKFKPLFMKWQGELASYGYANFVKVLDAQNYGVPQHRERVFMVSILGDNASFHFPEPFPLEKKLKDVLESHVDEKYYLSEKCINGFLAHAERHKNDGFKFNPTDGNVVANTILASSQSRPCDNFIKTVGNLYDNNKQAGRIYDAEGIAPTLDNMASGGNKSPKIVEPQFGNSRLNEMIRDNAIPSDEVVCVDTYNKSVIKGVFCTIKANIGTENMKYVTEPLSCAMRGRNLDNPSDRKAGCTTGQRLEIGDDKANTITTVQKDRFVVVPKIIQVANISEEKSFSNPQTGRIYSSEGLCPTLDTMHGGGRQPKIVERYRIRKLTPREVLRLMNVDDEDIDKLLASGISNTQLYRMGGNSICVSVLYHIFRKLFIDKENENQQLTLF